MKELISGQRLTRRNFGEPHFTFIARANGKYIIRRDGYEVTNGYEEQQISFYFELLDKAQEEKLE